MIPAAQLALPFAVPPQYAAEDFAVSDANREAHGWVMRWPDWNATGLCLYGQPGSGKTHLAHVWADRTDATFLTLDEIESAAARPPQTAVIEHLHLLDARETALFHFYNAVRERGGSILFTSCFAPARMQFALPDLASRLKSLPAAELREPDDALLASVLAKHFRDRQIMVGEEVVDYLVPRIERSFAAARTCAERLDRLSLSAGRRITVALARDVVGDC